MFPVITYISLSIDSCIIPLSIHVCWQVNENSTKHFVLCSNSSISAVLLTGPSIVQASGVTRHTSNIGQTDNPKTSIRAANFIQLKLECMEKALAKKQDAP